MFVAFTVVDAMSTDGVTAGKTIINPVVYR